MSGLVGGQEETETQTAAEPGKIVYTRHSSAGAMGAGSLACWRGPGDWSAGRLQLSTVKRKTAEGARPSVLGNCKIKIIKRKCVCHCSTAPHLPREDSRAS